MKFSNFRKGGNQYEIDGVCDFCKKDFSGPIIISISLYTRSNILKRPKSKGAVFLWNTPGPTIKDIEDYLAGKDLIKIKCIAKILIKMKKDNHICFGFPKLVLACEHCFRKEVSKEKDNIDSSKEKSLDLDVLLESLNRKWSSWVFGVFV